MKKALVTLATILTLAACSDKSIEGKTIHGKIVGENELKPSTAQRIIFNIPQGRSYMIQDNSGELYLAMVTNGEYHFNQGDEGSFTLGEKFFSGSFEGYGETKEEHFSAYKLDGYSLR